MTGWDYRPGREASHRNPVLSLTLHLTLKYKRSRKQNTTQQRQQQQCFLLMRWGSRDKKTPHVQTHSRYDPPVGRFFRSCCFRQRDEGCMGGGAKAPSGVCVCCLHDMGSFDERSIIAPLIIKATKVIVCICTSKEYEYSLLFKRKSVRKFSIA